MVGTIINENNIWYVVHEDIFMHEDTNNKYPVRKQDIELCPKFNQKQIDFDLIVVSEGVDFPEYQARLYTPIDEFPFGITMLCQTTAYQVELYNQKYSVDVDYNNLTGDVTVIITDSEGEEVSEDIFATIEDRMIHAGIIQKKSFV